MIASGRPTAGLRLRLVLRLPRSYEGTVTTPNAEWDVRAEVDDEGEVTVHTTARAELADYTRRVVRIAARHARDEGMPLPRMIQRWRADQA
jgi:antitoxin component of MazEF toxin-antitoxin module